MNKNKKGLRTTDSGFNSSTQNENSKSPINYERTRKLNSEVGNCKTLFLIL